MQGPQQAFKKIKTVLRMSAQVMTFTIILRLNLLLKTCPCDYMPEEQTRTAKLLFGILYGIFELISSECSITAAPTFLSP